MGRHRSARRSRDPCDGAHDGAFRRLRPPAPVGRGGAFGARRDPPRGASARGSGLTTRRVASLTLCLALSACANAGVSAGPSVTRPPAARAATPSATQSASPSPLGVGRVVTGTFHSAALNRTMPYTVYLPPGYDADPSARFPTLYMLHGGSGSNQEWVDYGLLKAADLLMGNRTIPQFIIALPQGDQEYWVDHITSQIDNGEKWGTYLAKEVVPMIDGKFRTFGSADARAIGGLSMGGHAAMQLPMNFPGIWSVIGAHSPSLRAEADAPTYLGRGAEFAARD